PVLTPYHISTQTIQPSPPSPYYFLLFFPLPRPPPTSTLFPYTTLFRSPPRSRGHGDAAGSQNRPARRQVSLPETSAKPAAGPVRSEEHTSELQSRSDLVCRLLLEKKKKKYIK